MLQYMMSEDISVIGYVGISVLVVAIAMGVPFMLAATHPSRSLVPFAVLLMSFVSFLGGEQEVSAGGDPIRQVGWTVVFAVAALFAMLDKRRRLSRRGTGFRFRILHCWAMRRCPLSGRPADGLRKACVGIGGCSSPIAVAMVRQERNGNAISQFAVPSLIFLLLGVVALVPGLALDSYGNYRGLTYTKNGGVVLPVGGHGVPVQRGHRAAKARELSFVRRRLGFPLRYSERYSDSGLLGGHDDGGHLAGHKTIWKLVPDSCIFALDWPARASRRLCVGPRIHPIAVPAWLIWQRRDPHGSYRAMGNDARSSGTSSLAWGWYGGFWLAERWASSAVVVAFDWVPGQAHNGYIEVLNGLGSIGVLMLLTVIGAHIRNICLLGRSGDKMGAMVHSTILAAALLLNVAESSLMRTTHLWWIVLTI